MSENQIQFFYERVLETWNDLDTFILKCDGFQNEWRYTYPAIEICKSLSHKAKSVIELSKTKLRRKTQKCVMIGKVSSGKSTLINALLSRKVLPSGFSCRTNCFIEIKKSSNEKNYILVNDKEYSLNSLKDLADGFSPDALPSGSRVELLYSSNDYSLLSDDMQIIDTPGFGDITDLEENIDEICGDTDMLIFVVSSIVGIRETERNFVRRHNTILSKLNIIIVYTFWDKPQLENVTGSDKMKSQLLTEAKEFLHNDLHISIADGAEKVFFISAEEKLSSHLSSEECTNELVQSRNDEFDKFFGSLKTCMSHNSLSRRMAVVNDIYEILTKIFSEVEFCVEEMLIKGTDFAVKLRDDLNTIDGLNDKINSEIEASFKESYNVFFDKGLEIIRSDIAINDDDIRLKLNIILQELTVVTLEKLKMTILDLIDVKDEELQKHCINILQSLYFPFYFNLEKHIKSFDMDALHKSFVEINRVKKVGSGLSIAGAVIGAAATLASGGILAGVILPIPTLLGASALGVAGAAVGGGAAGGISNALISINRESFGYFYRKEEAIIKKWWSDMEKHILDSYKLFLSQISTHIDSIMTPLKEEFYSLPNKINFLRSETNKMKSSLN